MDVMDTVALYERILSLVQPQELHHSSNVVLQEELSALVKVFGDLVAAFAKVEEVREAVNQLEQGKPPTGRSDTLMEVMDNTMQLQHELHKKLKKVANGMKVEDVAVEYQEKRQEKRKRGQQKEEESSLSDSSSSSSSEEEEEEQIIQKKKKTNSSTSDKKESADLSLAHEALKTISSLKTVDKRIQFEMKDKWAKALLDIKQILKNQSSCDAHTTDNPAADVTVRALEAAVVVFKHLEWTAEYAKEVRSLIVALSDACSKNEVLRIYFHSVRAQLESLEMSIPASLAITAGGSAITQPAATDSSLTDLLRTYHNLNYSMHAFSQSVKPKRIIEALSVMQQVMADDFMCVHSEDVRVSVSHANRWIGETSLQNDLVKEYRKFANSILAYSKKFPDKDKQVEWQRLGTSVIAKLDERGCPPQRVKPSHVSTSWSKKTKEMVGRLTSVMAKLEQWQDGIFSLDQLDKVNKTFNEVMVYQSKDWNPFADPTTWDCLEKLTSCLNMIRNQAHRAKRMKTVNKWKSKCSINR